MASYGTVQRPSTTTTTTTSSATAQVAGEPKDPTEKPRNNLKLLFPFSVPTTPEAAAVRIIRNLGTFGLFYTAFIWLILSITLAPKRTVSLIFLEAMTLVTCLYLLLLRTIPNSVVLHKIIDKRLVLALLAIVTAVELIVTRAALHLCVTLSASAPIILAHAVFRVRDDLFVDEEACAAGELTPLAYKKVGEEEPSNLV